MQSMTTHIDLSGATLDVEFLGSTLPTDLIERVRRSILASDVRGVYFGRMQFHTSDGSIPEVLRSCASNPEDVETSHASGFFSLPMWLRLRGSVSVAFSLRF